MPSLEPSDWVLIWSTLFLGALALVTPLWAQGITNWWAKPRLRVDYSPSPPGAHKTLQTISLADGSSLHSAIYFFRFGVKNVGRTQAQRVEAVIEELWHGPRGGPPKRLNNYSPTGMRWGAGYDYQIALNPSRTYFCDFLAVPDHRAQHGVGMSYVDLEPLEPDALGLMIHGTIPFYSQPNRLPPGLYRLHVAIFSENADPVRVYFEIDWHGEWHADEKHMLSATPIRVFTSVA